MEGPAPSAVEPQKLIPSPLAPREVPLPRQSLEGNVQWSQPNRAANPSVAHRTGHLPQQLLSNLRPPIGIQQAATTTSPLIPNSAPIMANGISRLVPASLNTPTEASTLQQMGIHPQQPQQGTTQNPTVMMHQPKGDGSSQLVQ
eukprot:2154822-Heterocapsa_arctica.AAC.1